MILFMADYTRGSFPIARDVVSQGYQEALQADRQKSDRCMMLSGPDVDDVESRREIAVRVVH